jgi:hypothetical protein
MAKKIRYPKPKLKRFDIRWKGLFQKVYDPSECEQCEKQGSFSFDNGKTWYCSEHQKQIRMK